MKRKFLRILLILIGIILVAIGGLLAYVKTSLPNVGDAPDLKVEATPERIERGKYLANYVMLCIDCHSTRDWNIFSGPLVAGSEGMGGEVFDQQFGFPGRYVAPNITPYGLKDWTDGEIFRAITSGVSKDGRPLFPIMPHPNFGQTDSLDIISVIAYIRTLQPIEHNVDESKSDFPMNFIIHTIPQKAKFSPTPDKSNKVAYGGHLVNKSLCANCHTKFEKGKFIGEPFEGGREFPMPDGSILRSANLTPHQTGIGAWTEEMFIQKFKLYADSSYVPRKPEELGYQTFMPWTMYAQMTEEDLSSMYAYFQSLTPIDNKVEKFSTKE